MHARRVDSARYDLHEHIYVTAYGEASASATDRSPFLRTVRAGPQVTAVTRLLSPSRMAIHGTVPSATDTPSGGVEGANPTTDTPSGGVASNDAPPPQIYPASGAGSSAEQSPFGAYDLALDIWPVPSGTGVEPGFPKAGNDMLKPGQYALLYDVQHGSFKKAADLRNDFELASHYRTHETYELCQSDALPQGSPPTALETPTALFAPPGLAPFPTSFCLPATHFVLHWVGTHFSQHDNWQGLVVHGREPDSMPPGTAFIPMAVGIGARKRQPNDSSWVVASGSAVTALQRCGDHGPYKDYRERPHTGHQAARLRKVREIFATEPLYFTWPGHFHAVHDGRQFPNSMGMAYLRVASPHTEQHRSLACHYGACKGWPTDSRHTFLVHTHAKSNADSHFEWIVVNPPRASVQADADSKRYVKMGESPDGVDFVRYVCFRHVPPKPTIRSKWLTVARPPQDALSGPDRAQANGQFSVALRMQNYTDKELIADPDLIQDDFKFMIYMVKTVDSPQ